MRAALEFRRGIFLSFPRETLLELFHIKTRYMRKIRGPYTVGVADGAAWVYRGLFLDWPLCLFLIVGHSSDLLCTAIP